MGDKKNVREKLEESIKSHLAWAMENGFGAGYDEYSRDRILDYPEAYAKYAIGLQYLYRYYGSKDFLDIGLNNLEWLMNNSIKRYDRYCWGLPYDWHTTKSNDGYLITTIFCLEAFYAYAKDFPDKNFSTIIDSGIRWVFDENKGVLKGDYYFFNYSPKLTDIYIPNAVAKAVGFLAKYMDGLVIEERSYVNKAKEYLVASQNRDGSWYYSDTRYHVDLLHMAYTAQGLIDYYKASGGKACFGAINKSLGYITSNLIKPDGSGKEVGFLKLSDITRDNTLTVIKHQVMKSLFLAGIWAHKNPETRLWGYAAAVKAYTSYGSLDKSSLNQAIGISHYVIGNLQDKAGYFYYRKNEKLCFIRHQSHIFESLCMLLLALREID